MLVTELEKAKTEFKIYAKRQQYDKSVNLEDNIIRDTENRKQNPLITPILSILKKKVL
ncbi:hypothetical protein [Chryseobacterium indoltheticum]|uniref:hypothetical protein n=1 Tax=Chryseobacterium indoltheticum TaxID=254 RepID=UPI00404150DD